MYIWTYCLSKLSFPLLNNFEKVYRRNSVLVHRMYPDVRELFGNLLLCFLKKEFVEDNIKRQKKISFAMNSQLPDSTIFFDEDTRKMCSVSVSESVRSDFFNRVRKFYCSLCSKLQGYINGVKDRIGDAGVPTEKYIGPTTEPVYMKRNNAINSV